MATLTITGVPDALHERLKQAAAQRGTSLDALVISKLEDQPRERSAIDEAELMSRVRSVRAGFRGPEFTEAEFREAEAEGRA